MAEVELYECKHGVPSGSYCTLCDDEVPQVTDYPEGTWLELNDPR